MPEPDPAVVETARRLLEAVAPPAGQDPDRLTFDGLNERDALDNPAIVDMHLLHFGYDPVYQDFAGSLGYDMVVDTLAQHHKLAYGPDSEWVPPVGDMPTNPHELDSLLFQLVGERPPDVEVDPLISEVFPTVDTGFWSWLDESRRQQVLDWAELVDDSAGRLRGIRFRRYSDRIEEWRAEFRLSDGRTPKYLGSFGWSRLKRSIHELRQLVAGDYDCDILAEGSYTYGLVVTMRQVWDPKAFQMGKVAATLPLAPGQKSKVTVKKVSTISATEERQRERDSSATDEQSMTSRSESEIARKTALKAAYQYRSQAGATVGVVNSSNAVAVGGDAARESATMKKALREAARKTASELRSKDAFKVSTKVEESTEHETVIECMNTNQEIPVTYVLFELERQYEVSEVLYSVTPVIMVARRIPSRPELDDDWIIANEAVLAEYLADQHPALQATLAEVIEGPNDEISVELLRAQVEVQRRVLDRLEDQLTTTLDRRQRARDAVISKTGSTVSDEGIIEGLLEGIFGGSDEQEERQAGIQAAERLLELVEGDYAEAVRKRQESFALHQELVARLEEAMRTRLVNELRRDQLKVFIADHVLPIHQLLWARESRDTRYYTLHQLPVLVPSAHTGRVTFRSRATTDPRSEDFHGTLIDIGSTAFDDDVVDLDVLVDFEGDSPETRFTFEEAKLSEVAEPDPLGVWGGLQIFALRKSNALTTLMALHYLGEHLQIWDPDRSANEDIDRWVDALVRGDVEAGQLELVAEYWDELREEVKRQLSSARPPRETVVVPWNQLMIDCIPGSHAVLEDFKLRHRAVDTRVAEAELQLRQLEGLLRVDEILHGDRPSQHVRIEGDGLSADVHVGEASP